MADAIGKTKISFFGAAGEVTGSRHLLEAGGKKILLDCGMFQGHRQESLDKNRSLPARPAELDAVLLSHAHIDHSGGLPLLVKKGLKANIYCTGATKELASIMLMDSARLQMADAKFFNKVHLSSGLRIEPLYNEDDARLTLAKFKACDFGAEAHLAGGNDFRQVFERRACARLGHGADFSSGRRRAPPHTLHRRPWTQGLHPDAQP